MPDQTRPWERRDTVRGEWSQAEREAYRDEIRRDRRHRRVLALVKLAGTIGVAAISAWAGARYGVPLPLL